MYSTKWLVNYLKLESCTMNVAICSKQGKVAFLSPKRNIRKTLSIHCVFIDDNGICSDTNFCLNTSCPHNRNNKENFAAAMNIPKKETDFDSLVKLCNEINDELLPEHEDFTSSIMLFATPFLEWV